MLFENIGAALAGIKANKLRSFLTMLGIMIGIAAIIAITMAGNGVSQYISNQMNSIGANKMEFYVSQKNWDNNVDTKSSDLISQDMIRDVCDRYKDRIKDVSLTANLGDGVVKDGNPTQMLRYREQTPPHFSGKMEISLPEGRSFQANSRMDQMLHWFRINL